MDRAVSVERIEDRILTIRDRRVMLDAERFPEDFMFRLTRQEKDKVVTNCGHPQSLKFSSALPFALTEHGAIMLASLLNTQRAAQMSVYVVRAFVKLKEVLPAYRKLARKWAQVERKPEGHDVQIRSLFEVIRRLMAPTEPIRRRIGFHSRAS